MHQTIITEIEQNMLPHLNNEQLEILHATLTQVLRDKLPQDSVNADVNLLQMFLSAKRVEGCSDKTVHYYDSTIRNVLEAVGKEAKQVTTEDIRLYLDRYQLESSVSKVTIDNIRRILSSFFSWLEAEDYIIKNPMKRIHKVKTCKTVKETYSDEAL